MSFDSKALKEQTNLRGKTLLDEPAKNYDTVAKPKAKVAAPPSYSSINVTKVDKANASQSTSPHQPKQAFTKPKDRQKNDKKHISKKAFNHILSQKSQEKSMPRKFKQPSDKSSLDGENNSHIGSHLLDFSNNFSFPTIFEKAQKECMKENNNKRVQLKDVLVSNNKAEGKKSKFASKSRAGGNSTKNKNHSLSSKKNEGRELACQSLLNSNRKPQGSNKKQNHSKQSLK